MSRYISLIVLLASIVIIGALFYKVMIGFFVPVFLAAVMVVVFRPLHRWVLEKVGQREHLAAGITTTLVIFSVLLPAALIISMAAVQGTGLIASIKPTNINIGLNNARKHYGLQSPLQDSVRSIEKEVEELQKEVGSNSMSELSDPVGLLASLTKRIPAELQTTLGKFLDNFVRDDRLRVRKESGEETERKLQQLSEQLQNKKSIDEFIPTLRSFLDKEVTAKLTEAKFPADAVLYTNSQRDLADEWKKTADADYEAMVKVLAESIEPFRSTLALLATTVNAPLAQGSEGQARDSVSKPKKDLIELQALAVQLGTEWQACKETLLGGNKLLGGSKLMATLREFANPSPKQIRDVTTSTIGYLQPKLISITGATAEFLVRLLIGSAIMIVSLYFFLYDGPAMIRSLMKLSPLDDRYEMELLVEFDRISRAIVLAMIFSAIIQGLTAGIGYYMTGVPSLILLTLLSVLCGLIPFVGPSVIWVPVCIYLAVYEERYVAASLLAIWGLVAVASIDNVVKAYVLHGQSQLHPLLALLSVLGGVQALGPIGIVVGPISVVLLQTLLSILQRELTHMDQPVAVAEGSGPPTKSMSNWMSKLKPRPFAQSNTTEKATMSNAATDQAAVALPTNEKETNG